MAYLRIKRGKGKMGVGIKFGVICLLVFLKDKDYT